MRTLFVGLTGGFAEAKLNHRRVQAKRPRNAFLTFHGEVREGWADYWCVETGIRRRPPPAVSAAIELHFVMNYIWSEGKSEAYRRDVTLSAPSDACYRPKKVLKIMKQRSGWAQSSLCTLPGSTGLHQKAHAEHKRWVSKQSLAWLVLHVTRTGKTNLCQEEFCFSWMKKKASWAPSRYIGPDFSKDVKQDGAIISVRDKVSEFVPRGPVNVRICTEKDYRNKLRLGIATRYWH